MATITKSRRRQQRHPVLRTRSACVEFEYPTPNGRHFRMPLVNVSSSGISFAVEEFEDLAGLDAGSNVSDATVRIGDCLMTGDLVLMHMTEDGGTQICGALFYPASDDDLVKLKSVIAGMEAASLD